LFSVIPAPRAGADEAATEAALAAQAGDPAAATALVRLTQGEVWRFVAALVDTDVADDLTQETFLRAFRALPGFAARASARTWLLGIARHVCADHIRTLQRRRRLAGRLPLPETEPDHAGLLGAADLIHRLSEERRGAFVLTQVIGLSYAQVADIEGVPVGTIRSRVARARDQLIAAVEAARAG
jgi:RNA polymerase sigma-70 factor (ECF subfamily)